MPIHSSYKLGTSFILPDRLTVRQDTAYQEIVNEAVKYIESLGHHAVGSYAYAAVLEAAIKSGLIEKWSSVVMPAYPEDADSVDLAVVYWAGPIIMEWVDKQRAVPKVSFWRRLRLVLTGALHR